MSHPCQVLNTPKGFTQLAQWLESRGANKSQTKLISEHTGRYGERLLGWTTETGWPHTVVKTAALKKVSGEHQRKTDGFDAEKRAEYGRRFDDRLQLAEGQKPAVEQIKRLQAERRKMVDHRAALKSKLTEAHYHNADMERIIEMWQEQVTLLTEHIDEIEVRIKKLISSDQNFIERHKTMQTAPGMGKVLGPLWLSLFVGKDQINPRKISSRLGFAPHPQRSGSSVRSPDQSTGFGNSEMRRVMHQAALSVKRNYPHYHE